MHSDIFYKFLKSRIRRKKHQNSTCCTIRYLFETLSQINKKNITLLTFIAEIQTLTIKSFRKYRYHYLVHVNHMTIFKFVSEFNLELFFKRIHWTQSARCQNHRSRLKRCNLSKTITCIKTPKSKSFNSFKRKFAFLLFSP